MATTIRSFTDISADIKKLRIEADTADAAMRDHRAKAAAAEARWKGLEVEIAILQAELTAAANDEPFVESMREQARALALSQQSKQAKVLDPQWQRAF